MSDIEEEVTWVDSKMMMLQGTGIGGPSNNVYEALEDLHAQDSRN